jgi:hypothetical protein
VKQIRTFTILLALAAVTATACSSTEDYPNRIIRRPLGLAVVCQEAGAVPVPLERCGEAGVIASAWILDGDAGLLVMSLADGSHFDADPFVPGFSAFDLGGTPIAIRGADDSRNVYVLMLEDDIVGAPSLIQVESEDLALDLGFQRQPLPCRPETFEFAALPTAGGDPVPIIMVAMSCPAGSRVVAIPRDRVGTLSVDDIGLFPSWSVPGTVRHIGVSDEGTVVYLGHHAPASGGDLLTRLDLGMLPSEPSASITVTLEEPGSDGSGDSNPRGRGAPAVTPDGKFLYVPRVLPDGVAVFDAATLDRVDVHAPVPDTPDPGNPLMQRLGILDIPMAAPPLFIIMLGNGEVDRALVALESGELVGVFTTAGEEDPRAHRIELLGTDSRSVASAPVTRVGGKVVDRAYLLRADLPSFGATEISPDPEQEGSFVYYGIRMRGESRTEPTEAWTLSWEGRIPGASGTEGRLLPTDDGFTRVLEDLTRDFCGTGVQAGSEGLPSDIVVLRPDAPIDCGELVGAAFEYQVLEVRPTSLRLAPLYASMPLPGPECIGDDPIPFEVRVRESWAVTGARTGFLHNLESDGDTCRIRDDADPLFHARALTALPGSPGQGLSSCPVRFGDPEIGDAGWAAALFSNIAFSLTVHPGCRSDADFLPVVAPTVRDTELVFQVTSGSNPRQIAVGGLPAQGFVLAGDRIVGVDAANGLVMEIDPEAMTLVQSRY